MVSLASTIGSALAPSLIQIGTSALHAGKMAIFNKINEQLDTVIKPVPSKQKLKQLVKGFVPAKPKKGKIGALQRTDLNTSQRKMKKKKKAKLKRVKKKRVPQIKSKAKRQVVKKVRKKQAKKRGRTKARRGAGKRR